MGWIEAETKIQIKSKMKSQIKSELFSQIKEGTSELNQIRN